MLEAIAFLCGAAVMALEMTGSRILAPHLGSSVLVWTALIGVIMACLSAGYWLGGKMADKDPSHKKLAVIILGAAFCVLAIAIFQQDMLSNISTMIERPEIAAIAAATVLFGPASLLLGMVSPYIVRVALHSRNIPVEKSGAVIGRFSAMSAVGSILGTFAGGYYLIAWVGSRQTLFMLATSLMIIAFIALISNKVTLRRNKILAIFPIIGLALGVYGAYLNSADEQKALNSGNFITDTRYSSLLIQEGYDENRQHLRLLSTPPELTQSAMRVDAPTELVLDYTRAYALAWQMRPQANKLLMMGGAGYSIPKYLLKTREKINLDVVEIDPGMTELAKKHFALQDDARMQIFHEDARTYLNRYAKTGKAEYDIIMGDTFSSVYNIPFQLSTVECAQRVYDSLKDDGVYIGNVLSAVTGPKSQLLSSIKASFDEVFDSVHIFPLDIKDPAKVQNVMLVALKEGSTIPAVKELEAQGMNAVLSKTSPQAAADEFATAYKMLNNEWKVFLVGAIPPLYDDYAPVERYALPLTQK
ncbi:fused MFS/spermidine synthase [Desulfovibrio sp. OttesenSCG-928-F07]|nr:fused MFS/spermidine synthase [Desulfovibrio sp. OttesenSCG-928-F07]